MSYQNLTEADHAAIKRARDYSTLCMHARRHLDRVGDIRAEEYLAKYRAERNEAFALRDAAQDACEATTKAWHMNGDAQIGKALDILVSRKLALATRCHIIDGDYPDHYPSDEKVVRRMAEVTHA